MSFTVSPENIGDSCYGGVWIPIIPVTSFEMDVPGPQDLPTTIVFLPPAPFPRIDVPVVWDAEEERIVIDPAVDPLQFTINVGEVFPIFPCVASADITGGFTPTSETAADFWVEVTNIDISPSGPFPCLLPAPRNPDCVIGATLPGVAVPTE